MGSLLFNPGAHSFGAPPGESYIGITFNNKDHTAVGIPHSSGSKYAAQFESAFIAAQCRPGPGCHYNGNFSVEIYNASQISKQQEWVVVTPANGLEAWAAIRFAWGGYSLRDANLSQNTSFRLTAQDKYTPVVFVAGDASTFGSLDNFTGSVLAAEFSEDYTHGGHQNATVTFTPPGQGGLPTLSFPWAASSSGYRLPSVGGVVLDDAPSLVYDGPFMRARLGEAQVLATAKPVGVDLSLRYDFDKDATGPA